MLLRGFLEFKGHPCMLTLRIGVNRRLFHCTVAPMFQPDGRTHARVDRLITLGHPHFAWPLQKKNATPFSTYYVFKKNHCNNAFFRFSKSNLSKKFINKCQFLLVIDSIMVNLWKKLQTLLRDSIVFIVTKFCKNPSSGSDIRL